MNILVTGAKGFVGRNLCAQLRNIRDGKAKNYALGTDLAIFEYDIDPQPRSWTNSAARQISSSTSRV